MRELVYYIATSIDGFIADPAGDFSSFPLDPQTLDALFERYPETCPVHAREALGVTGEPRRFDTVLMGRRTHQPAVDAGLLGGAYPHLRQILAAHRAPGQAPGIEVIHGDLPARVRELKAEPGRDIWLCGGAELAGQLLGEIDELQLKINPLVLGAGIPLFRAEATAHSFHPAGLESLPGGVTLATFRAAGRA
ncbi:dihydrofolate reductase [Nesterenkonia sp. E16_7]|uniref:dihydrofolate reductase family protein n=1 Tax=unclassified Nesterenkonia TaxID=2629769 RepID=UPI001A915A5F|nr:MULTISPECIES: dihydrofolate reductase family protein [unclassified Nesterenkonia]MBO0596185.1 dihydrofolate reductase [Nesterenkonia sp. E16_10]MBO0598963.1 dihydrofolate reductase [Nesterenkonia sp. E16_7]